MSPIFVLDFERKFLILFLIFFFRLDKLKMDTEEARNSLEAFIYSMRERLYEV